MARPARFSLDDVLDAAAAAVLRHGRSATLTQIATELGGPTGSIYHRFASREELLASLWLRSVHRFHIGLLQAYALPDPQEALMSATRHIPTWCRDHPAEALALTLHRQPVLAASGPASVRDEARTVNDEVDAALRALVPRRYGSDSEAGFRLLLVGTRMNAYGLVRPFVGTEVPAWLDEVCVAAATGILALGDREGTGSP